MIHQAKPQQPEPAQDSTHKIVLASGNAGKLREFSAMFEQHFADQQIELISQKTLNVTEAEENGLSFVENAILKARNACAQTGLPALADDSGIEVDALKGAPGIYSARFAARENFSVELAGEKLSGDALNNACLLSQLEGVKGDQRSARFRCVLVYMRHENDPNPQVFQGRWDGHIVAQPQGDEGFGYDPVFQPNAQPNGESRCAAQFSKDEKNAVSHRAQALKQLIEHWQR